MNYDFCVTIIARSIPQKVENSSKKIESMECFNHCFLTFKRKNITVTYFCGHSRLCNDIFILHAAVLFTLGK